MAGITTEELAAFGIDPQLFVDLGFLDETGCPSNWRRSPPSPFSGACVTWSTSNSPA
jgi:hypothetical protein